MGAPTPRVLLLPAGRPGPHDLTEDRELADVVGVVVAHQAHLTEDGVPRGVRDRCEQVGGGIGHELVERRAVGPETLDRQRELLGRRSGVARRPVLLRPAGREVRAAPDVVEDVPLGDPDVLEHVPGRVGDVGRWLATEPASGPCAPCRYRRSRSSARLGAALAEVCAYYRTTEQRRANLLRDLVVL